MPQISPIFWFFIVIMFSMALIANKEGLPKINSVSSKKKVFASKKAEIKW